KPRFAQIASEFLEFINGAQLIIHNAPFDIGFINHEFAMLKPVIPPVTEYCGVIDTLVMARQKHPGQKNNLDVLCKRYGVDNSQRDLHGALLDSEILADVYLLMTGGQTNLMLGAESEDSNSDSEQVSGIQRLDSNRTPLKVIRAGEAELAAHEAKLSELGESCLWKRQ
uniref:DNA polymerase III subunit epsilon n=1 Tax=Pseudomaricurvus sp. TaxID=2004510 RepID=UPI003F6A56EF